MPRPAPLLRTVGVLGATTVTGLLLARAAAAPLGTLVTAATEGHPPAPEQAVAGACAVVLVCCYAVWLLGLLEAAVDAACSGAAAAAVRRVPCPRVVRHLAATALTASALAAPPGAAPAASADPHDGAAVVGLPLPDRVPTPRTRPAGASTHLVVPGDSLWRVAQAALPPGVPDEVVDRGWRRIAGANRSVVQDPDLILPGTPLRVPPLDDLLGKDQP